jgi:transcriptional regulator with XRE-family HTH domain
MVIGQRLRALREEKQFSQGIIEKRTGLLRCYISRVENGYTVPAVETLEKFARALEVPMYQLFYDGAGQPNLSALVKRNPENEISWGKSGKEAQTLAKFRRLLSRTKEDDRKLLLFMARKMVKRKAV